MAGLGVALLAFAAVGVLWPLVVAIPLAALAVWVAVSSLARAHELNVARSRETEDGSKAEPQRSEKTGADPPPGL
jgi:hypothetical protein